MTGLLALWLAGCTPSPPPAPVPAPVETPAPSPRARWLDDDAPALAERARARHLVIAHRDATPPVERSPSEARALAEALWLRVHAGEPLDALARARSDGPSGPRGGDLGAFEPGTFAPAFEAAVGAARPGALAPLVETAQGVHVIVREPLDEVHVAWWTWAWTGAHGASVRRDAAAARALAAEAVTALRAGEPTVVSDVAGRTLLGRRQWAPALERAAYALGPGEVAGPIETPTGFVVLARR